MIAVLAAAAASALLMAGLYDPDVDPSRVYYGTDTRAAGFLIGAALACAWSPSPGRSRRSGARPIDLAGLAAIGALAGCFLAVDEFQPLLYRGGFALVALVAALVIAAVAAPSARLVPAALGWRPLRWVGLRSYSIYLWHWPVFMVTRPQLDLPLDGLPLLGLRLLATLALAEISYRLVETPIRRGALGRAWRELRESHGARQRRIGAGWAAVAGGGIALVAVLGAAAAHARPPAPPAYLAEEPASPAAEIPTAPGASAAEAPTAPAATPAATRARSTKPERARAATAGPARSARMTKPAPAEPPEPPAVTSPEPAPPEPAVSSALSLGEPQPAPPEPAPAPPEPAARVTAIGDSVMRGAAEELGHAIGNVVVDAKVGRQVTAAIAILRARRDAGQLGDVVVVHLGNNGFFNAKKFDELMEVLSGVRRVVLVNVKVPRRWQSPNDGMLSEGVGRYPNAVLVDWYAASADRPELFWHDGIHLRPTGARLYADLIAAQVNAP